jgi:hypothetical protein
VTCELRRRLIVASINRPDMVDAFVNDHEPTSCTAAKIPHSINLTDYQANGAIELLTSGQRAAFSAKR